MLRTAADQLGVGWEKLAEEAGISPVSAWRVEKGEGSVKSALALREALERRGRTLPPPVAAESVGPDDLIEWSKLGQKLYAADRDQFTRALNQVRELVRAMETLDSGISLIAHPLPRQKP